MSGPKQVAGAQLTELPGGIRLATQVRGEGPPVVWVAGLGDDHASWEGQVERFSSDYRCVTFDNRGCGGSDRPQGPYSVAQMADDAHQVVEALGVGPVVAVGSSMGGAICQEWVLRYPDDLTKLVLTNTWGEQDPYTNLLFDHWIALAESQQGSRLMESLLLYSVSPGFLRENAAFARDFLDAPVPDLEGFAAAAHACRGHHALERLTDISVPTLVISGDRDILTRPDLSQRLASRLQHPEVVTLPVGHMVFWEQPEAFNDVVADFLKR